MSTAAKYARFTGALVRAGQVDGVRLLGPRTLAVMTRNHLPGGATRTTLGRGQFAQTTYDGIGFGLGVGVSVDPVATKVTTTAGEFPGAGWPAPRSGSTRPSGSIGSVEQSSWNRMKRIEDQGAATPSADRPGYPSAGDCLGLLITLSDARGLAARCDEPRGPVRHGPPPPRQGPGYGHTPSGYARLVAEPSSTGARRSKEQPPSRIATLQVVTRRALVLHAALTVVLLTCVAIFAEYWFSQGDLQRAPVVFALMTAASFTGLVMYSARWLTMPLMRRPVHRPAPQGWRVAVVTTFVPVAEPLEMLEQSLAAMVALDYAHDTWVLDEGDDPDVRALCQRLGAHHFSRHDLPAYQAAAGSFERRTKHGNYNAWLDAVGYDRYDILVNFDPDHVPARTFLSRTLGYFDDDSIGYVQAAQVYYNQSASFIARGAAEESYAYYSSVQMTSYALGYPIVTGCHTAQRIRALREVGGFAAHEADDLLITIYYRVAGWSGVYVPEVLATGLTPVDWDSYLTQQRRWARSVLDVKFRIYPEVARRLPPVERITSLLHGLYYLHGFASALGVALLAYLLVAGTAPAVLSWRTVPYVVLLVLSFQACEIFRQRYFLRRSERGLHWRAGLLRIAKWPVILLALYEALRPRDWEYSTTRKTSGSPQSRLLVVPHLVVIVLLAGALVLGMVLEHSREPAVVSASLLIVTQSLLLVLSSLRASPAPYDRVLFARAGSR